VVGRDFNPPERRAAQRTGSAGPSLQEFSSAPSPRSPHRAPISTAPSTRAAISRAPDSARTARTCLESTCHWPESARCSQRMRHRLWCVQSDFPRRRYSRDLHSGISFLHLRKNRPAGPCCIWSLECAGVRIGIGLIAINSRMVGNWETGTHPNSYSLITVKRRGWCEAIRFASRHPLPVALHEQRVPQICKLLSAATIGEEPPFMSERCSTGRLLMRSSTQSPEPADNDRSSGCSPQERAAWIQT
jgi:hypothetical protein